MAWAVEAAFRDGLERLEWESQRITSCGARWHALNAAGRATHDKGSRSERAFYFVYVAAILEDLVRSLDTTLPVDLRKVDLEHQNLRPEVLALLGSGVWDSISSERVIRVERRRLAVLASNDFYTGGLSVDTSSLDRLGIVDGRTIRPLHLEVLWDCLCISPTQAELWPTPAHRQAIQTIADKRNLIAHHEADPRAEAFRFNYGDLAAGCKRVTEVVEALFEGVVLWLESHPASTTAT